MDTDKIVEILLGAGGWWILSSIVQALPEPEPDGNRLYRFVHDLAHALGANWSNFGARRFR